jgi:hypothetical protein
VALDAVVVEDRLNLTVVDGLTARWRVRRGTAGRRDIVATCDETQAQEESISHDAASISELDRRSQWSFALGYCVT